MSFSVTPRASYKPLGRQPFRPGQWSGYKAASKHTTYIQNNFFGSGYSTGMNYGNYGNYGSYCNHDDGGLSKGAKWLLGLGVGTTLLGGILKMFGVGGGKETGSAQPAAQPAVNSEAVENDDIVARNTTPEKTEETPEEKGSVENPPAEEENSGIKWNDINSMTCRDNSGKTLDITGELTLGDNGNPPKSFTITDSSSGNVYKFELTSAKDGDKPVYTCVSRNGQATTTKDNAYTLETKEDGTPELVQHEGQGNYGDGLKFGSTVNNGGGAAKTFSKTITVNTSVGPTTVTVTANSQKELDEKVKAEEEKSQQWQGVTDHINGKETTSSSAIPDAFSNPWANFVTNSQTNQPATKITNKALDAIHQKYGFKDGDKFIVNKQIKSDKSGFTYTLRVNGQTHKISADEYKELQNASGIKG